MKERVVTRDNQHTVEGWLRRNSRVSIYQRGPRGDHAEPALFRIFDGIAWRTVWHGDTVRLLFDGTEPGRRKVQVIHANGGLRP